MRRHLLLGGVLAVVALSAAGGWVAASAIKSPAQVASETKPPNPSAITAAVERRNLASTVTARGTVRYGQPQTISLAASTYNGAQLKSLVTKAPAKGANVAENAVMMEANGRPVRALIGNVPMYRDIKPGDQGEDVRQLEEALERMGYRPGTVDNIYDGATQGAVEAWYRDAGYTAPGATDEQRAQLRSAHSAVSSATSAVLQATDALAKVRKGVTAKDLLQGETDVRARDRDIAKAEGDLQVAQAAEALAVSAEASAHVAEATAVAAANKVAADNQLASSRASADVVAAQHRVAAALAAKAAADQVLSTDLTTIAGAPPVRVASDAKIQADQAAVSQAADAIIDAQNGLTNAQLAAQAAAAGVDQAARQASAAATQATQATRQAELSSLQAAQATGAAGRAIEATHDAADLAAKNLELLKQPPDESSAVASLAKARSDLADAKRQEAELASTIGIVVPANEVLFFPTLPLRIDDAKVERGDDATKEVMVVTTSRLALDAAVSIADAPLVHVGDHVDIVHTQLGIHATGKVSKVASKPGTDGVTAQQVYLEVIPDDVPEQLTGASVSISIAVRSTAGAVLAVPVAAVTVDGSGAARVQRVAADGTQVTVPVTTGLSAQGFVEVKPVDAKLEPGDRVLVGSTGG